MQGDLLALGTVPVQERPARPGDSDYEGRAFAQVVLRFDDGVSAAREYAIRCDRTAPVRWDP
jgi:hypothetical protein